MSRLKAGAPMDREGTPGMPPDQDERRKIVDELDRCILVEAAAGTGKTTSMVARMVALVESGRCRIDNLAAVTFTRKAAAQLRLRFHSALKRRKEETDGVERDRLADAEQRIEQAFMGTIHSFCGRLLRERPVEAGVPLDFVELDEERDKELRRRAWNEYLDEVTASDSPLPAELRRMGIEPSLLEESFVDVLAAYPDVERWPTPSAPPPDLAEAARRMREFLAGVEALVDGFPERSERGSDEVMGLFELALRRLRHTRLERPADLVGLYELFEKERRLTQKMWPDKKQAKAEKARYGEFCKEVAGPFLYEWRSHCYEKVMRFLLPALDRYERLRLAERGLNFADLLSKAARMLREGGEALRKYLRARFSHLLVDEFQDTDPVQAEVMMLLCSSDPCERDWRHCRPVPGSLFVVGDPKQSIYRFRRADIVVYNQVRRIIEDGGGVVVSLFANFRSDERVIEWINSTFAGRFPPERNDYAPAYVPLQPGRPAPPGDEDEPGRDGRDSGAGVPGPSGSGLKGVFRFDCTQCEEDGVKIRSGELLPLEADFIARFIGKAIRGWSRRDDASGKGAAGGEEEDGAVFGPGDFMIVTKNKKDLAAFGKALQSLGIPHQVTGGSALGAVPEVELLLTCLEALVEPDNPVRLVAVLRSPLFGFDDVRLYDFARAGGRFEIWSRVPSGLEETTAAAFERAFSLLRDCARHLARLEPAAAVDRICRELGLQLKALLAPGGNHRAGGIAKAVELLRLERNGCWSPAGLVRVLRSIVGDGRDGEAAEQDVMPARPLTSEVVRIMNLHKSKGLEAKVVFLAGVSGNWDSKRVTRVVVDRSGDESLGYLNIGVMVGSYRNSIRSFAHPPQWTELEDREKAFTQAENTRLQYVAATRAGAALCVSVPGRISGNTRPPWLKCFKDVLADAPELDDPGKVESVEPGAGETVTADESARAERLLDLRRSAVSTPSYSVVTAKAGVSHAFPEELERAGGEDARSEVHGSVPEQVFSGGRAWNERGREFGTAVHAILERSLLGLLSRPEPERSALLESVDSCETFLRKLSPSVDETALLEAELERSVLETCASVLRSELCSRVFASRKALLEVPFEMEVEGDDEQVEQRLLRGVVDLVFREDDGWVIVDWKTDACREGGEDRVLARYASQLEAYRMAWSVISGEKVKESGLYLTSLDTYVTLP